MKLGDFLNTMAAKIGAQNEQQLISLLSNSQLANVDIDDNLANRMNTGLMSLDGAKSSTDVKKHFDAMALNAIDAKLLPLAQAYGASADFDTEKSTYKRIDILAKKIEEQIAAAKGASADVTKDAEVKRLNGELQKLQQQLTSFTTDKENEIATLKSSHAKQMLDTLIDIDLSGKTYANKAVDAATNLTIAKAVLNAKLAERGALVVNEGGKLKLKNSNAPELDLLDEGNKPVSFASFADRILAGAKLLEVSNGGSGQQTIIQQQQPGQTDMSSFNDAVSSAMSALGSN